MNDKNVTLWDLPGGPVAKTPGTQCRGPGFDPWSGNSIPYAATKSVLQLSPGTAKQNNFFCNCVIPDTQYYELGPF